MSFVYDRTFKVCEERGMPLLTELVCHVIASRTERDSRRITDDLIAKEADYVKHELKDHMLDRVVGQFIPRGF